MQEAILAAVQQLTQTGIFWAFHMPPSFSSTLPPWQWLSDLAYSLDDRMDPERPILPTRQQVGAIAVVATVEDYADLFRRFRALFDLFNKLIASEDQVNRWVEYDNPFEVVPGVGKAPNWGNQTLSDVIPPLGDLADKLVDFANQITTARTGLLQDFADFLRTKANILQQIADEVEEILELLVSLLDFEGAWLLPIYGEFNTEELQDLIRTAEGGPLDVEGAEYTAGAMFLATGLVDFQGSTWEAADALFDLFGLPKEATT